MTPARFVETRSKAWDELDAIVTKAQQGGIKSLSGDQLHQLTREYPAVAIDVARARMYKIDAATQRRINDLAIASHGLLYRAKKPSRGLGSIWTFFRYGYPRLFRRMWLYMTIAVVLFTVGFMGTYVSTRLKPANAYLFVPGELDLADNEYGVSSRDISERFRKMDKPPMAAGIMTNNITVAFNAFALGITAGIGTCFVLVFNSMMLGGFAGHFANHGLSYELLSFLAPHGVIEIFAILVASAAGLRLGLCFAMPGELKRSAALRVAAHDAVLLVLGTVPMFVVAGLIEGFVTPSYLPGAIKIVLGFGVWFMTMCYLLFVGRDKKPLIATIPATVNA